MNCSKRIASSKVTKELVKLIGNNDVLQTAVFLNAFEEEDFSQDFLDSYAALHKSAAKPVLDPNTTNQAKTIAKAMLDYYYKKHPDINSTTRTTDSDDYVNKYGYSTIFDREKGKLHIATFILDEFNKVQNNNIELTGDKFKYYRKQVKNAWLKLIFNSAAQRNGLNVSSIKTGYENAQDKAAYIDSLLGNSEKSITDSNLFAVYKELFGSEDTSIAYINEIFADPRLADVHSQIRNDLEAETTRLAADASADENESNTESNDPTADVDMDTSITTLNNHIGEYTSFMTHVGPRIRNYFNTLRRLSSPTIGDLDTSNSFGIAETMDANACSSILYNSGDFHNIETMIQSIEKIGRTVAGFEAFVQLAYDLRNNIDFATEMFTVFAKTKMAKLETVIENDKSIVRISNYRANPRSTMVFDMRNDIKSAVTADISDIMSSTISKLNNSLKIVENDVKAINSAKTSKEKEDAKSNASIGIENAKQELIKILKTYFPSLQDAAIKSYIELNNNATSDLSEQLNNIRELVKDVTSTCNATVSSYKSYNDMKIRASEIRFNNKKLDDARKNGKWVDNNEYKDERSVYSDDYISSQDKSIQELVNKLLPYSVIQTQLNSRNIHGNNNSDIINNSMLTKITKMLEDNYQEVLYNEQGRKIGTRLRNKTLEEWGKNKLRSKQYKYSNILLEQKDKDGNILNRGLFRYEDDQLVITEYADELIKFRLFNGSSSLDNGTNILYSEMTTGDYLPTDFINFFQSEDKTRKDVANYFLRTPSDAPKTFTIRAPKYDTTGLFVLENNEKFNSDIEDIIKSSATVLTADEYNTKYRPSSDNFYYSTFKENNISKYIVPDSNLYITDMQSIKKIDGTENNENGTYDGYVTFVSDNGTTIVLKGTVEKAGKGHTLTNATFEGILNKNAKTGEISDSLPENIYNTLRNYFSKELRKHDITINNKTWSKPNQTIDTTHNVYQMIKNQFRQEMLDAAIAINHYFELEDAGDGSYYVILENGSPKFNNGRSNTKGYKFYHLGSDGKVLTETKTGYKLGGNVFHSNKFTLAVKDKNGKIVKRNYLDEIIDSSKTDKNDGSINFLYGRALKYIAHLNEGGQIVIDDIQFSAEQEARIDEALKEFLSEYKNQSIDKVNNYNDFIKGVEVTDENITDFSINQLIMHYNYDELLEGSTKFYKDSQTILKRAKEYQGSGVPYGIADYTSDHVDNLSDIDDPNNVVPRQSFLNSGTVEEEVKETVDNGKGKLVTRTKKDENGNPVTRQVSIQDIFKGSIFEGTTQRNGFRAVTIKNTQRTNTEALKELEEKLVKQGLSREHAKDILWGPVQFDKDGKPKLDENNNPIRRGGFTETKVNDAQSYITVQEWVRRVAARGQLQRYLPLIKKLIACESNPNIKLTADDVKEFVQVQKNFYYDQYYDERYGIYVPRQIKNAEFVLVPSLIKGTQLEQVYNIMRAGHIDQLNTVETSKAANEDILTLWDNNGNIPGLSGLTEESSIQQAVQEKGIMLDGSAQIYSYNNLYTQQETPQHMNAENKAGIQIMKKIIDNLPNDDSKLGRLKKEYFKLFTQNIENSFSDLLDEFEIPRDKNGNIELDEDGNIKGINLKVFYNKLKEEMMRTGLDSNLIDYVTIPKDSSEPLMPSYMNNILTKFESVVQSLFNNSITRQKLPGFHSAQITNIGWKPLSDNIDSVQYSKELRYHPDGKGYIEVMMPASFLGIDRNSEHYKNMTDAEILEELSNEKDDNGFGLDTIIGYRIPTEGKQSVCNMKVVGFISDANGSTIVVPDDWVSQTGSDFDIDSVYGIQYETYKKRDGQVKKIKYKTNRNQYDWFDYIRRFADKSMDPNVKGYIKQAKDEIRRLNDAELATLEREETEAWNAFSDKDKEQIKLVQNKITKKINKQGLEGREAYRFRLNELITFLNNTVKKSKNKESEFIKNINNLIPTLENIDTFLSQQSEEYNEKVKERIDRILKDRLNKYNEVARKAGLLEYADYVKSENDEKANGKQARNSRILDIMQTILSDPAALEENLSRSNFDDLTFERNKAMDPNVAAERAARSPYNVFDQIAYQEDAMSGAKLKAFSVTLDTFCSVCNKVRPNLDEPVYIVYNSEDFENPQDVMNRFKAGNFKVGSKTFGIRHTSYGWTKDNRNTVGKILTAYSSQTTAFILDAIKEGSIPNVNQFTFSTFKTLLNIGTDYKAAENFIMQPGVSYIVNAYNANNSVFSNGKGNPIHLAIREIAKQLDINAEYNVPITAVLASINKQYGKEFNKLFKQEGDENIVVSLKRSDIENLPIIVSKLQDRLQGTGEFKSNSPVKKKALFDLGVILAFSKLQDTANKIGDIARCCNPDKFGAKQTVFATRQVFDSIDNCIFNRELAPTLTEERNEHGQQIALKIARKTVLSVNGQHILASIYPGVDDASFSVDDIIKQIATSKDIQASSYPSLYAFLKYASVTSAIIAKTIFATQDTNFINLINGFKQVLSGYNPTISEETYNDVQKYVLSSMYKEVPSIKFPVTVRFRDGHIVLDQDISGNILDQTVDAKAETSRIFGYERSSNISVITREEYLNKKGETRTKAVEHTFEVKDINNPTDEEMELFEQLSPAQKVQWIKTNFSNPGLFNLLNVSLYNSAARGRYVGMQTIEYREQNVNSNVIYSEFRKLFYNDNPLIVSAAIDLVKYAVQVEGMRMSATAVNKIIDNKCLIEPFGTNGLGFVDYIKSTMSDIKTSKGIYAQQSSVDTLYENYLRSHPETKGIKTVYLNKKNIKKYGFKTATYGSYYFKMEEKKDSPEANQKVFDKLMEDLGVKTYLPLTDTYKVNKYIRLRDNNNNTLYKIVDGGTYVILYPLGRLETNENSEWSANELNNNLDGKHLLSKTAYEILVNDFAKVRDKEEFTYNFFKERMEHYKETGEKEGFFYKNRKDYNSKNKAVDFSIEKMAEEGTTMNAVKEEIIQHFSKPQTTETSNLYIKNRLLEDYIFTPGFEYGSEQTIHFGPNEDRKFRLIIPENIGKIEKFYLKPDKDGNVPDASNIKSPSFRKIIQNAQEIHLTKLSGVVQVVPIIENEAYAATLEELDSDSMDFADARRKADNDEFAVSYLEKLRVNDIDMRTESISATKDKRTIATRETAKYVRHTADYIKRELFNQFVEDPDTPDTYLSITDDKVLGMIKTDPKLMDKYMYAVNIAQGFINTYSAYEQFDATSEDSEIQRYIDDIKDAVDNVKKLPIEDVMIRGAQTTLVSESANPLVKEGLIDVMDGFWKTYGFTWQFHDIMENGTPILQVIMRDVMGDIDAKQKSFIHKTRKEYWAKIKDIQKRAAAEGKSINWDNIVDADGRFIQDYDNSFIDKINELRTNMNEAAKLDGYGSVAHLKAKLEFDEFKAKHCNQEAAAKYYLDKCAIERAMLFGRKADPNNPSSTSINGYPELYSKYMKLYYERLEIYHYMSEEGLDEDQRKRLNEISQQMYNLYRPGYYVNEDGNLVERPYDTRDEGYSVSSELLSLYGNTAAATLKAAIDKIAELNDEYFAYDSAYGFEDQLRINLNLIASYEQRDANGIPTKPQDWLDSQPEYVEAKTWVRNNARFTISEGLDEHGNPVGLVEKLKAAFRRLSLAGNSKNAKVNEISKNHNDGEGIYDEHHIPDGRKLSAEEIESIKTAQEDIYQTRHCPPMTDRILISNAKPNEDIYTADFYKGMAHKGNANPQYLKVVTELNKLLEPYYNNLDGNIHFELIPDTEEGIELLKTIANKYQELRLLKKTDNVDSEDDVADFIKNHVEFVTNEVVWKAQINNIQNGNKSNEFKAAFVELAYEHKKDGSFAKRKGQFIPNRFLYSYAKPKGEPGTPKYDNYVDKQRKEDLNLINSIYRKAPTRYYYQSMHEAMARAQEDPNYDYMEWYNANHIYNPYTRKMEPLDCWTNNEIRDELFKDNTFEGKWTPRSNQREKKVRDGKISTVIGGTRIETYDESRDKRNHDYNPDEGLAGNYVKGAQKGEYDSKIEPNEFEKEMRDYLQETLMQTANVESARRYFKNGYLPRSIRQEKTNGKMIATEAAKLFGFAMSNQNGKKEWYKAIGFENDRTPLMPMTKLLDNKLTIDLQKKIKEIRERDITLDEFNGNKEQYDKAIKERDESISELEDKLKKERQSLLNKDWLNVIDAYLEQANHYNAVQENKQKLYFLHNMLKNMKMYSRKYGMTGDLDTDDRKSSNGDIFVKEVDENLIKQYENQLRRLLFDQWKEKEGSAVKFANMLQGFTSANYMMLNIRGGIANVTLGETGILSEAAAKEYFGYEDWGFGTNEWRKGQIGFARSGYESMFGHEGISYNKQDAIVKFMNVVDYDEVTGVCRELNLEEASKKIRDFMFSPQTMGEHFMQNSVLFAMMHSHKLVTMDNGETTYMSKRDYINYRQSELLNDILSDKQMEEFNKFKEDIKKDKNKLKDYAWFRRDALTDFIYLHCDKKQIDDFIKARKENEKKFEEEFKEKKSLYDQVELGKDGKLAFVEGSELAKLDEMYHKGSEISEAMYLLGRFAEKTRKVNNKIHGVYNRQGAAYIERKWYGSLIMQYHKHLPMGILKRYMARGHFNETRGTVDKGMVESVYDLLRLNWDKVKVDAGLTKEQTDACKAFSFMFHHCVDYIQQLKTTWNIVPAYERANILRNLGDAVGTIGAMMTVAALWYIADDDEDMQDSLWFNLTLYEADRLASEAFMYNPVGLMNEGKKLMSTPIAAQSIISDAASSLKAVTDWVLDDEYDPYYHSGRFAGERKLSVYFQRRIPMWNGIRSLIDTPDNNHYYKLGQNPIGIFDVKKHVTGE